MNNLSDLAMWSLIVGALLPLVISVIQQPKWPNGLRAVVTVIVSLIAGAGTAYFSGTLDGRTWVSASLVVVVAAMTAYDSFWKHTGVTGAIESGTSPSGTP